MKQEYISPTMQMVDIAYHHILCTSITDIDAPFDYGGEGTEDAI